MNVVLITLAVTMVVFVVGIFLTAILLTGRLGNDARDTSLFNGNQPAE